MLSQSPRRHARQCAAIERASLGCAGALDIQVEHLGWSSEVDLLVTEFLEQAEIHLMLHVQVDAIVGGAHKIDDLEIQRGVSVVPEARTIESREVDAVDHLANHIGYR